MRRFLPHLTLLLAALAIITAWWLPNRPQLANLPMPAARFHSVSFSPYRPGESPLTNHFPTQAEVDQDLAIIAKSSRGVRTYAAIEGKYDLPALARTHGLKMWEGIWLGPDRASNQREIAAGIAAANTYPDVIERVVVGNEVLLRHDLPPDELIAAIDQVRHAIHQPVTYADFWNFFVENPALVSHIDIITIHVLPYWEDNPVGVDGAMARVRTELASIRQRFPTAKIAIGETGWPSRGRWRRNAAPGLVNEVRYLRNFVAFANEQGIEYNFFQAFDNDWKYGNEGVVGASWGLWTAARTPKFPFQGPVQENANWPAGATFSIVCGLLLYTLTRQTLPPPAAARLAAASMALGAALGFAWQGTTNVMFDSWAIIAGIGNLAGQTLLALLYCRRLATIWSGTPLPPPRTAIQSTAAFRTLLHPAWPQSWQGPPAPNAIFEDLLFLFLFTALVLQLLLLYDPRYRDFPIPTFAVPGLVVVTRWLTHDRTARRLAEWVLGTTIALAALVGATREGTLNLQSLEWFAIAIILSALLLLNRDEIVKI